MKFSLDRLFNNKKFLAVFSLILAILIWFFIAIAVEDEGTNTIQKVPIQIDKTSAINALGLELIDIDKTTVNVIVKGQRYIVGNLAAENISVLPNFSSVTGPGTYDLPLDVTLNSSNDAEIAFVSDKTVRVIFDKLVTKSFPVEINMDALTIQDGYLLERYYATPASVSVTGPEADVAEIAKCVVNVSAKGTLNNTTTAACDVVLLDADDKTVHSKYIQCSEQTVDVVIPILTKKTIPVTFDYLNVPNNFPIEELQYTISQTEIEVAGPADQIDKLVELHLGYVDISDIELGSKFHFKVALPNGFSNLRNIEDISIVFDTEEMQTETFNINSKNIKILNEPADCVVSLTTQRIPSVTVIAPPEVMETLTNDDLVGEIDLSSRDITSGEFRVPVTIHIPSKGLVWALGDYSAIIQVKER